MKMNTSTHENNFASKVKGKILTSSENMYKIHVDAEIDFFVESSLSEDGIYTDHMIDLKRMGYMCKKEIKEDVMSPKEGLQYWYNQQEMMDTGTELSICHIMMDYYLNKQG